MSSSEHDQAPIQRAAESEDPNALQRLAGQERARRSEFRRAWNRFKRYRPAFVGLFFIGILCIVALIPGVLAPYTATEFPTTRGAPISWDHPFGADGIGRDMLSRMIFGTRVALIVAFTATFISVTIGVMVGATAGYFGGWVDSILSRVVDAVMAIPLLVLVIALVSVLGAGLFTTVLAIGVAIWAQYARVVRADIMSLRERDYVVAARTIGAGTPRIIVRHMIPNALAPVIVISTLSVGSVIILEAGLSFLGLGVQPPNPSWGGMLSEGREHMRTFPHISIIPGIAITLTVLAFNLVGDALRDALDPHQRE
jgi:ABC-type dipeptide/oligopeptide/nickel transport system permease subunit